MQPRHPITTDIVLIGAGHAHVEVLRRAAMRPMPGVRLTLITREPHAPYSGMLPGLIRGDYAFDAAHIDCAPLAAAAGARLLLADATGIDPGERVVNIAGRPDVAFDLLSVDVGGRLEVGAGGIAVKPIGRFLEQLAALETRLADGARVAVVGGGAGGTELALALAHRFARRVRISLVNREAEPVMSAPPRARRALRQALVEAGVETLNGVAAGALEDGRLALSDGSYIEAAVALWATGVGAPAFLAQSGLACDAAGCIRVDCTLRSVSHPFVFAAGDCAAVEGDPRPKSGVWAVRAGAPLAANLRRAAAGRALTQWRPQRDALAILGTGGGRAVAWRNGFSLSGRLVWHWKDTIDRRWMRMYHCLRPMPMAEEMRCAGCGAKIGPAALQQALAGLTPPAHADIPVGLAAADDAAIALPPPGLAVVQSVDHFRAFIDDPYLFGQIAAAHALSDLHAMGARPWTALAVAAVPYMRGRRMQDDLAAMMRGAIEVLTADGCALVGGHSAEGAEAALGFAVNGLVDPAKAWRKSGLRPGDALLLTKPIGTGIVLAAAMRGLAKARWLQATTDGMRRSNATAARILREHGVTACTDVTGFGLAGHLQEMLTASGVSAIIDTAAVKLLPGALELAEQGVASSLAPDIRAVLDLPDHPALPFLIDPQTSGGLLAGVPAESAGACLAALLAAGIDAAMIGHIEPAATPLIRVEIRTTPMRMHRIAAIPADGIGPEVIAAGLEALDALVTRDAGFSLAVDHYDWGSDYYRKHGVLMPTDGLDQLRKADAIYFGAVGAPDIPDHITLWGLRLPICQGFDQYANIRPTRILPGVTSPLRDVGPGDLDWLIVRENSEGEYSGVGGRAHRGLPEEVATEVAIFTRVGVERIMRYAFASARRRPRRHLTVVTKSNAQRHGMVFWDEIAALVAADFPDVAWDKELVDAMTMRMVKRPRSIDTVVATNLHADILSDLAAALSGSLGVAPTGNVDPERRYPSMFEPIHGSAFDITGLGIANPVASFWTASLMLEHLGEATAAAALMTAVEQVCAAGVLTPDLGGKATTKEVTRAVCEAIRGMNLPPRA